jgi:hypothetical protein
MGRLEPAKADVGLAQLVGVTIPSRPAQTCRYQQEQEMTEAEYKEAKRQLDELNKAIDDAPMNAKPVFEGIAKLHDRVTKYERKRVAE